MTAALSILLLQLALLGAVDDLERQHGVSNVRAAAGNGIMALGVSARGEITALRWPSPGLFDQLHYLTLTTAPDGASAHQLARGGATANMGLFVGLVFERAGELEVEWLRDAPWETALSYVSTTSSVIRAESHSPTRALSVVQELWLSPDEPLLALRVEVDLDAARRPIALLLFENLAPCDRRVRGAPYADWQGDDPEHEDANDFGLLYSSRADALLHFRPAAAAAWLEELAPQVAQIGADQAGHAAAEELVDRLTLEGVEGTYLALAADLPSAGHQAGRFDDADVARPQDAYFDAQDGLLRAQPAVLGSATGALRFNLPATAPGLTLYIAAGASAGVTFARLERARLAGFAALAEQVQGADAAQDRTVATPDTDQATVRAVAKRAVYALRGMQAVAGAHAAAVAGQPPLALDCPAETAFVDEALDVAAQADAVARHQRFLRSAQRSSGSAAPAGTFARCYYTDGVEASEPSFSLDATGWALWSAVRHHEHLEAAEQAEAARDYAEASREMVRAAADALLACDDEETGLTCAAPTGDDPTPRQELGGAVAALAGLRAAGRFFGGDGDDRGAAERYRARADALAEAIFEHLTDAAGLLDGPPAARALALHPAALFDGEHGERAAEVARLLDEIEAELSPQGEGALALGLRLWSLLRAVDEDDDARTRLDPLVAALFELADPATRQYGAALAPVDDDGDGAADRLQHRVGTPHLPSGAFAYLAAIAAYGRRPPPADLGPIDTCFCAASRTAATPPRTTLALVGMVLGLALLRRGRRWRRGVLSCRASSRHQGGRR